MGWWWVRDRGQGGAHTQGTRRRRRALLREVSASPKPALRTYPASGGILWVSYRMSGVIEAFGDAPECPCRP